MIRELEPFASCNTKRGWDINECCTEFYKASRKHCSQVARQLEPVSNLKTDIFSVHALLFTSIPVISDFISNSAWHSVESQKLMSDFGLSATLSRC